jgi:hypothetical protein
MLVEHVRRHDSLCDDEMSDFCSSSGFLIIDAVLGHLTQEKHQDPSALGEGR